MQMQDDNRWVCPSDRQLSLRAKLSSGWSVRACPSDSEHRISSLTDNELDHIRKVITRAQSMESNEQMRVGYGGMIDRLEQMRGRCSGDGRKSCMLCAEKFTRFIGESPVNCIDCKNNVCSKCSVDISILPKDKLTSQSRHRPSHCLCKICSESREMWKRSGAWFFRSLPKFVLPQSNSAARQSNHRTLVASHPPAVQPNPALYNHRESICVGRRRSVSSESSDDEIVSRRQSKISVDLNENANKYPPTSLELTSNHSVSSQSNDAKQRSPSLHVDGQATCVDIVDDVMSSLHGSGSTATTRGSVDRPSAESPDNIEFSLLYDSSRHALDIRMKRGGNLKSGNASSDPHIKACLLPDSKKSAKLRTKSKRKTLNPTFNETISFCDLAENDLSRKLLQLKVFEEDRISSVYLGEVVVELSALLPSQLQSFNLPLQRELIVRGSNVTPSKRPRTPLFRRKVGS